MSIGSAIRRVAGPLERPMGRAYRRVFVNVTRTMESIAPHVPTGHLIDVGGGDGDMLNVLLNLRPDLRVTMLDLNATLGRFLEPQHISRVTFMPRTGLADYCGESADAVLVSDVLHHVPLALRREFIGQALALVKPGGLLIVKDVEPGYIRSWLGVMADRYISGDLKVELSTPDELAGWVGHAGTSLLSSRDAPNFALAFAVSTTLAG